MKIFKPCDLIRAVSDIPLASWIQRNTGGSGFRMNKDSRTIVAGSRPNLWNSSLGRRREVSGEQCSVRRSSRNSSLNVLQRREQSCKTLWEFNAVIKEENCFSKINGIILRTWMFQNWILEKVKCIFRSFLIYTWLSITYSANILLNIFYNLIL